MVDCATKVNSKDVPNSLSPAEIDAVITWVDGNSASHRTARASFMEQSQGPLNANATNPHRWAGQ